MSRRANVLIHFAVPLALAVVAFVRSVRTGDFNFEVVGVLLGTYMFFAAPHLLWLGSAIGLRLSGIAWHAGFIVASLVLGLVAISPMFGLRDPSGLPYHWLLYWPLAMVAQFVIGVAALLRRRFHDA